MRVNGLNNLKKNWYDSIMIRNKGYEVVIDIKRKDKIKTIKTSKNFNFENTGSTHKRIESIINYYLNNNKVSSISNKSYLNKYKGSFVSVDGSRSLHLQIASNFVDVNNITKNIFYKYNLDRNEFLYNNKDIENIEIFLGDECTSYDIYEDNKEKVLMLRLLSKFDINKGISKISNFEKQFIINFIKDKLSELDEEVRIDVKGLTQKYYLYEDKSFGDYPGNYIVCSKFKINISSQLLYFVMPYIKEHNKKIKNDKKLQLTFDDIKY